MTTETIVRIFVSPDLEPKRAPRAMSVAAMAVAALAMLCPATSHATKPLVPYFVAGCVIAGQFVPYSGQSRYVPGKLPYWVRKSGGTNLEGQEIHLYWTSTSSALQNYVTDREKARWERGGACDRGKLSTPAAPAR